MPATILDDVKSIATIASTLGTFIAISVAVISYRRTETWKRAEFLAKEMKEFLEDARVAKALQMIDWGSREIELSEENAPKEAGVMVTRELQTMALRPHILLNPTGSDSEVFVSEGSDDKTRFTPNEASIRDCYDAFLDGLERFAHYLETDLIDVASLRPYLGYWVNEIYKPADSAEDAAWCAALLTYISFYKFDGVLRLFEGFSMSILPSSPCSNYESFLRQMEDQGLAQKLAESIKFKYIPQQVLGRN